MTNAWCGLFALPPSVAVRLTLSVSVVPSLSASDSAAPWINLPPRQQPISNTQLFQQ